MGNFANTLFSVLLGWVQRAVAWLWQLIGADGADGLMGWVLDNWLALAVGLCTAGLLIDFVVYLIRWQPYRVWRRFLHGRDEVDAEEAPAEEPEAMQWLYANGETATPEPPAPVMDPTPAPAEPVRGVQRVIPARKRRAADGAEYVLPTSPEDQPGYHRPYYPPQWQAGEHHQSDGGMQG